MKPKNITGITFCPTGDKLPDSAADLTGKKQINYVHRYAEAASWLNMLIRLTNDKQALKRELNISIMSFWDMAAEVMKIKGVRLPYNPKRLKAKIKEYQVGGYASIIELHKWGNDFSKKLSEAGEALLKGMLSHRNKHDDTVIAAQYNIWAKDAAMETITPGAVGYWRKKWENYLILARDGAGKTYNKLSKRILQQRPSAPLLLVNSDDNVMDCYFRKQVEKNGKRNWVWTRPTLYVVRDAYNDYILGYAATMGEVSLALIKEAYRNAQRHVMEITGDAYLWQEIKTDRWGVSGKNTTPLEQFYNSMSLYKPAAARNAQAKIIERAFGIGWHQEMKKEFPDSYAGYNISAKEKLNPNLKVSGFPHIDEAAQLIDRFIWRMRLTKRKGSDKTRHEEWIEAFNNSDKAKAKLLTAESRLQIFGKTHEYTNEITAEGIAPTLCGQKIRYELSQEQIFQHIGKKVQVTYDEHDLSMVLITDGKGLRITVSQFGAVPMAQADYQEGDKQRHLQLIAEKKTLAPRLLEWSADFQKKLPVHLEGLMQAGVMDKAINHRAEKMLSAVANGATAEDVEEMDDRALQLDLYNNY